MKESSSIPDTFKTVEVTQQDNRLYEDNDESNKRLRELGYQVEFRREMSFFGVLGMSFCAIGILTGMSSAFQTGLFSGGPLGATLFTLSFSPMLIRLYRAFLGLECV